MLPDKVAVNGLQGCFKGGEHVLVGVAHEAICEFGLAGFVRLIGQDDLVADKLYFVLEVQRQIRGAAIGTEERNGIDAIRTAADAALKIAKQVISQRCGLGTIWAFNVHAGGDESVARLAAVEIPGVLFKKVADVLLGFPHNQVFDGLDVFEMDELPVGSNVAGVRTYGLAGTGRAADTRTVLLRNGAVGWCLADEKEARRSIGIGRVLIRLAGAGQGYRHRKKHVVGVAPDFVTFNAAQANVAHLLFPFEGVHSVASRIITLIAKKRGRRSADSINDAKLTNFDMFLKAPECALCGKTTRRKPRAGLMLSKKR